MMHNTTHVTPMAKLNSLPIPLASCVGAEVPVHFYKEPVVDLRSEPEAKLRTQRGKKSAAAPLTGPTCKRAFQTLHPTVRERRELMSEKTKSEQPTQAPTSQVSQIFGPTRLLPGEAEAVYRAGLIGTIKELGATTHLQTYIAEKIFQCMWWMRRYESQKHLAIINAMVEKLVNYGTLKEQRYALTELLQRQEWAEPAVQKIIKAGGNTAESLMAYAVTSSREEIQKIDQLIALRVKTLGQLQQSYEALVNRSVVQERMKLQNELLRRDLKAIDVPSVELDAGVKGNSRAKPKAKSGQ